MGVAARVCVMCACDGRERKRTSVLPLETGKVSAQAKATAPRNPANVSSACMRQLMASLLGRQQLSR